MLEQVQMSSSATLDWLVVAQHGETRRDHVKAGANGRAAVAPDVAHVGKTSQRAGLELTS